MNPTQISIIIPTFNEASYLPKLLECLKRQSYTNLEIIVSDRESTDRTREIAMQNCCQVVDGGTISVSRNQGAEYAGGDLLCFMDSDVLVDEVFFENAIQEFKKKRYDIASCVFKPITKKLFIRFVYQCYNTWIKLGRHIYIPRTTGTCIFVTKRLFMQSGGFDEAIKLAEDHSFGVKCSKLGRYGVLNSCVHYVSIRRVIKEGLWKLILKSILCELHLIFFGEIKHDRFNYYLDGYKNILNPDDQFPAEFEYFKRHIFKNRN